MRLLACFVHSKNLCFVALLNCFHVFSYAQNNLCIIICMYNCFANPESTDTVAVDVQRSTLTEYGRYLQEVLPKYIQQAQITHGYVGVMQSTRLSVAPPSSLFPSYPSVHLLPPPLFSPLLSPSRLPLLFSPLLSPSRPPPLFSPLLSPSRPPPPLPLSQQ